MNIGEVVRELDVQPLQWPEPQALPQAEPAEAPAHPVQIPEEVPA